MKVVVTDLDGTIVGVDGSISSATAAALMELQEFGVTLFLATGRTPHWIESQTLLAELATAAVCCYGSIIWHSKTRQRTQLCVIPGYQFRRLLIEISKKFDSAGFAAYDGNKWVATHSYLGNGKALVGDVELVGISEMFDITASVLYVSSDSKSNSATIYKEINSLFPLTQCNISKSGLIDIRPMGTNKATGLRSIFETYVVDKKGTVGFGNDIHDIPIFDLCEERVAVANAHPALKKFATLIAPPIERDGVAYVLRDKLALLRRGL